MDTISHEHTDGRTHTSSDKPKTGKIPVWDSDTPPNRKRKYEARTIAQAETNRVCIHPDVAADDTRLTMIKGEMNHDEANWLCVMKRS